MPNVSTTTDQALPDDYQPLPGTPFGILLVGALGWLVAVCGLILLPWAFPGAAPTTIGSHLLRFSISITDETTLAAIVRHGLDVLPYLIVVLVPLSLVLAMGWRRARSGVKALTILGLLGIPYAIGLALEFGPMLFLIGCILIAVSGWLGWSLPVVRYDQTAYSTPIAQPGTPMAVPFDSSELADGEPLSSPSATIDQPGYTGEETNQPVEFKF